MEKIQRIFVFDVTDTLVPLKKSWTLVQMIPIGIRTMGWSGLNIIRSKALLKGAIPKTNQEKRFVEEMLKRIEGKICETSLYKGVKETFRELNERGEKIAISSNLPEKTIKKFLEVHNLKVSEILGREHLRNGKEGHVCIIRRKYPEVNIIYISDSPKDMLGDRNLLIGKKAKNFKTHRNISARFDSFEQAKKKILSE